LQVVERELFVCVVVAKVCDIYILHNLTGNKDKEGMTVFTIRSL